MAGEINWGLLDTQSPARVANSFYEGRLQRDQQQQQQRQNALADLQYKQALQSQADDEAYRDAWKTAGSDQNALLGELSKRGLGKQAIDLQGKLIEQESKRAATEASKASAKLHTSQAGTADYDLRMKKHEQAVKDIAALETPEQAIESLQRHVAAGDIPQEQAAVILQGIPKDPAQFPQWQLGMLKRILAAKDQLPQFQTRNTGGTTDTLAIDPVTGQVRVANSVANTATPGEVMTDKRQREEGVENRKVQYAQLGETRRHNSATESNPNLQHIETPDGIVSFNPKTGQTSPVMGQNGLPLQGSKGLTESQGKAAGYGMRAATAHEILNTVGQDGKVQPGLVKRSLEAVPRIGEGLGTMANGTQTPAQQQVEQAQRDFVNAVLRQESGASISQSEFDNAKKQYFPQPGDSKEVIAQKKANRETAIRAFGVQAGPGAKNIGVRTASPSQPAAPTVSNW